MEDKLEKVVIVGATEIVEAETVGMAEREPRGRLAGTAILVGAWVTGEEESRAKSKGVARIVEETVEWSEEGPGTEAGSGEVQVGGSIEGN